MKKIWIIILLVFLTVPGTAQAYWVWSPDLGKWMNPKKAAKDTPEEQFAWAMGFYNDKNWDRAIEEFDKLPVVFPNSKLAAEGVYHAGLSWEEKQDLAKAADSYQKLIDRYPYSDRIKDAVKREFEIANQFASGTKIKVIGVPVLPGAEKALELYRHIVKNAPFGSYGAEAQFRIGELYKAMAEYEEAQKAYQAVVDEYPQSELVNKARYQIAYCSMLSSKKLTYNEDAAEKAMEEFEEFKKQFPKDQYALEADESIKVLRREKAAADFETASFYEKQKKLASAKVYYQEIVNRYPETPAAERAKERLTRILNPEAAAGGVNQAVGQVNRGIQKAASGAGKAVSAVGQTMGKLLTFGKGKKESAKP